MQGHFKIQEIQGASRPSFISFVKIFIRSKVHRGSPNNKNKKFGPDRFSRFDVYWIQTDRHRQTNSYRQAKFIYRFLAENTRFFKYNVRIFVFNYSVEIIRFDMGRSVLKKQQINISNMNYKVRTSTVFCQGRLGADSSLSYTRSI